MRYHETILGTIGDTPLVRLRRVARDVPPLLLAKLEMHNPGGSVKDRIGLAMIEDAERRGLLKPGGTIVEPTSGNTGIALALAAVQKGYKIVFTIPDKMSQEKIRLVKAFGARVVVCPTAVPPDHAESYYKVAERLAKEIPDAFLPNQYYNPMNPEAHYRTTGPEVWEQTEGKVTHFVCGMGTGGTISGAGRYLKERNPAVRVVGVDPRGSVLKTYFDTGALSRPHVYKIEGIGEDFVPPTLDLDVVDEVLEVEDRDAYLMARRLAREEGILAGSSSGAAVVAALRLAADLPKDAVVVVLLPDTGERYLSKAHNDEWLREQGFLGEGRRALRSLLERKEQVVEGVVTVAADATVRHAIDLMRQHGISQLPVEEEGKVVGGVRERDLVRALLKDPEVNEAPVRRVMGKAFPFVAPQAGLEAVQQAFLQGAPAVLVGTPERMEGIVTRIDLLEYLSEHGP